MIKPYDDEFSISYADQLLENVFVLKDAQAEYSAQFVDEGFQVGEASEWLTDFETIGIEDSLMISVSTLTDDEIINELQTLAFSGVSVFLLLGDHTANKKCIEALSGRCCIRTGVQQSGMLIIADHQRAEGSWGKIYSQSFTDDDVFGYSMTLESRQVEDYYRLFCYLFWQKASYEYLIPGERQSCNNDSIGMIDTAHKHVMPENLPTHLETAMTPAGVYSFNLNDVNAPDLWQLLDTKSVSFQGSELLLSLEQMKSAAISALITQAEQIQLFEQPLLPQILFAEKDSWLLPLTIDKEAVSWALKLTENQKQSLENYQFTLQNTSRWALHRQLQIKHIQSPLRFSDNIEKTIACEDESVRDLGKIQSRNYDDFENKNAEDIVAEKGLIDFNRNLLAKNTRFKVAISPPILPEKAMLDNLHKQWADIQQKWIAELERLKSRLSSIEKSKEGLAESIKRHMGGFLTGQLNKKRTQEKQLNELNTIDFAVISPSHREEMITALNELSKQFSESEDKLAEEADKAEQIKQWEEKEAELNSQLATSEQKYKKACSKLNQFETKMQSDRAGNEQNLLQSWQAWVEDKQNLVDKEQLVNFSAIDVVDWYQNNAKNLSDVFLEYDAKKNSQTIHKYKKALRKMTEDFNQKKDATEREEKGLKQHTQKFLQTKQRLNDDIESHKKSKAAIKPTNKDKILASLFGKNSEKKTSKFEVKFPNEELPEVGELHVHKNKRYLAITMNEESSQGKLCAKRLNADLVVLKENV